MIFKKIILILFSLAFIGNLYTFEKFTNLPKEILQEILLQKINSICCNAQTILQLKKEIINFLCTCKRLNKKFKSIIEETVFIKHVKNAYDKRKLELIKPVLKKEGITIENLLPINEPIHNESNFAHILSDTISYSKNNDEDKKRILETRKIMFEVQFGDSPIKEHLKNKFSEDFSKVEDETRFTISGFMLYAILDKNKESVELLLKNGVDPNSSINGQTLLEIAIKGQILETVIEKKTYEIVKLLLDYGAHTDIPVVKNYLNFWNNKDEEFKLYLAKSNGFTRELSIAFNTIISKK